MSTGLIQLLNSPRAVEEDVYRRRIVSTAFTTQALLSFSILLAGLVLARPASMLLFGVDGRPNWVIALVVGTPMVTLASGYLEAVLFAGHRFDLYVKASSVAALAALFLTVVCTHFWGVDGAFWSLAISSGALFLIFTATATAVYPLSDLFAFGIDLQVARSLVKMSLVLFGTGVMIYGSSIILRRIIMDLFGPQAAGIVQVPIALTAYFTPFLTNALWGHLHPKVSAAGDVSESRMELRIALGWNALLCAAILPTVLAFSGPIILLAYSTEFLSAKALLPTQLLGDVFYFPWFSVSVYFLAIGRLRWYFMGWVLFYGLVIGASFLLAGPLGLLGFPAAYSLASVVLGALAGLWMVRYAAFGVRDLAFVFGVPAASLGAQVYICGLSDSIVPKMVVPILTGLVLVTGGKGVGPWPSLWKPRECE
jgi:O-antigen/teichoic acid export membrane protein